MESKERQFEVWQGRFGLQPLTKLEWEDRLVAMKGRHIELGKNIKRVETMLKKGELP